MKRKLGIAIIAILAITLILEWSRPNRSTPIHRYGWHIMRTVAYPDWNRTDVIRLYKETYRPLRYERYTGYADALCTGRFVNVLAPGYRRCADETWPPATNMPCIWFFGGSTTFGHGLADWETVPARMRIALTNAVKRDIAVYNFGRASYKSDQERILFQELLKEARPTHVVFMDGLNDFIFQDAPFGESRAKEAIEKDPPILNVAILGKLRIIELARKLIPRDTVREHTNHIGRVISDYACNLTVTTAICREYGICSLFVWQPIPTYRYDQRNHAWCGQYEGAATFPEEGYRYMQTVLDRGNVPSNFVNMANVQDNLSYPLYLDAYHYNASMADWLAKLIASQLVDSIKEYR